MQHKARQENRMGVGSSTKPIQILVVVIYVNYSALACGYWCDPTLNKVFWCVQTAECAHVAKPLARHSLGN